MLSNKCPAGIEIYKKKIFHLSFLPLQSLVFKCLQGLGRDKTHFVADFVTAKRRK